MLYDVAMTDATTEQTETPIEEAIRLAGGGEALGAKLNPPVSGAAVSGWKRGERPFPSARAIEIEFLLGGKVSAEALCPVPERGKWARVKDRAWPHVGGRPFVDVAAAIAEDARARA